MQGHHWGTHLCPARLCQPCLPLPVLLHCHSALCTCLLPTSCFYSSSKGIGGVQPQPLSGSRPMECGGRGAGEWGCSVLGETRKQGLLTLLSLGPHSAVHPQAVLPQPIWSFAHFSPGHSGREGSFNFLPSSPQTSQISPEVTEGPLGQPLTTHTSLVSLP